MEHSGNNWWVSLLFALAISQSSNALSSAESAAPPVVFPPHWQISMLHESVFNSRVFVVEAGQRSRPTVMLVHGLGQAGLTDWLAVIPALEQQFHVIALDLPGFGRCRPYIVKELAVEIYRQFLALVQQCAKPTVGLVPSGIEVAAHGNHVPGLQFGQGTFLERYPDFAKFTKSWWHYLEKRHIK